MLKKNNYKAKRKSFYIFLALLLPALFLIISSLNISKIFESEQQELISFAQSFSSPTQLFDDGDILTFRDFSNKDILPASSNLFKSLLDSILGKKNSNLKEIKVFIKFKNFEKILKDRETALLNAINEDPRNVPCKISDGINTYKCKVRLKGDLPDHWNSVKRMSLRINVKGGYIHGMKEFSIQKPKTRQFPYDAIFHDLNNQLGRLSSISNKFYNVKVNGDNWGVMNAEPIVDEKFIEINEVKRLGIFRISNQQDWAHSRINGSYPDYFISDPTINISMRGNDRELLRNSILNEVYSHIFLSLSSKDGEVFDRQAMIGNLVFALVWGDLHALYNDNAWYVWNPYEKKLEPVLTDQAQWKNTNKLINNMGKLPFEYQIMFEDLPLTQEEFLKELVYLENFFKNNNPIDNVNDLKERYFPNDQRFTKTPIFMNLSFLRENIPEIIQKINFLASIEPEDKNLKKITLEQLEQIDKVSEIVHFSDGTVRIFNLLGDEIKAKDMMIGNIKTNIDKILPPSKPQSLSYIDIKTDLLGKLNDSISVNFIVNGVEKKNRSTNSLININYDFDFPKTGKSYCAYYQSNNQCILKGKLTFEKSVIFNTKTIINPGTTIILQEGTNLIFNSSVIINGTKKQPVNFEGGGFGGIYIRNNKEQVSIIQNSNFNNLSTISSVLQRYTGSVNGYGGEFKFKDVFISNGKAEDQLNIVNAKVDIIGLKISNALSDAFDCDFCTGTINNINLSNVGGDGLDISGSHLKITKMYAKEIKDKAFSVGEKSFASIDDALYDSVATGIAVKDSSIVEASNITLENIEYDAFMTYVKKPFYAGDTRLEVSNYDNDMDKINNICIREKATNLIINNKYCSISKVNIDELYKGRMKK